MYLGRHKALLGRNTMIVRVMVDVLARSANPCHVWSGLEKLGASSPRSSQIKTSTTHFCRVTRAAPSFSSRPCEETCVYIFRRSPLKTDLTCGNNAWFAYAHTSSDCDTSARPPAFVIYHRRPRCRVCAASSPSRRRRPRYRLRHTFWASHSSASRSSSSSTPPCPS